MIGERIWGKQFIKELSEPHSDPGIRKMEEEIAELTHEFYSNLFLEEAKKYEYDLLPACYKKVKV